MSELKRPDRKDFRESPLHEVDRRSLLFEQDDYIDQIEAQNKGLQSKIDAVIKAVDENECMLDYSIATETVKALLDSKQ